MKKFVTWGGATVVGGLGAAAAFFLDPRSGPRRRQAAVEKSSELVRRERAHVTAMISGVKGNTKKSSKAPATTENSVLADAVRAAVRDHHGDVIDRLGVRASGGRVTLRGEVPELRMISAVAKLVASVDGVTEVNNLLRLEMAS